MDWDLADFLTSLRQAETPEACWDALALTMAASGVPCVHYGFGLGIAADFAGELTFFSKLPAEYLAHYDREGQVQHDHLVWHCKQSVAPALWHDPAVQATLSPAALAVERDAYDFGLRAGIIFPVQERGGTVIGGVSLAADTGREAEFAAILQRDQHRLHLMALFFHAAVQDRLRALVAPRLTADERECLRWLATGLRAKEVAIRMRRTEKAVEHLLLRARTKLGAANATHAVAKALALGLIEL